MTLSSQASRPCVGVLACHKMVEPHWSCTVAEKYLHALDKVANVSPVLLPAMPDVLRAEALLNTLDGLLLPGSVSNIEPKHYQQAPEPDTEPRDPGRDEAAIALILAAIKQRKPVLGICRGCQEINVALGGSLYQRVAEQPELMNHREPQNQPMDVQFDLAHDVRLNTEGLLYAHAGESTVRVNSLHGQGIRHLAEGLVAEAWAPDGLVEAFRHEDEANWVLGVQWHPEWQTTTIPFYGMIFRAFGDACQRVITSS